MKKLFSSFFNPYIGPILGITIILLIIISFIPKYSHENRVNLMTERAVEIINNLKKVRSYYTQNVIGDVKNDPHIVINYDHKDKEGTIPLPATLMHDLNEIIPENGMKIKMYSNYPFPNRENRVLNDLEKESLSYLVNNPDKIFKKESIENGQKTFNVAVADVFYDTSCVSCHNARFDTPKNDWKLGDVRGVFRISAPIHNDLVLTTEQMQILLAIMIMIILVLGVHYSMISILRNKDHAKKQEELEETVNERTEELQSTVKLLNQYKKAVDLSAIVSKTDKSGKITYVNDAFVKISQYSKTELLGKNHNLVRHEDMPSEFFKDLWDTIKAKKVWSGQIKNRAKDGSVYYVASTILPILNYEDEIEEFLAIRLDVSNIVEAQIKAKRADDAKSTFLANMSHEIRTPLNAIIGFSDLLNNSKDLEGKNKKQANIIHSSANSLLTIINDILDVSKIESGNFEVTLEKTDLYFVSEHVVELFSKRANEKHIKLVFNLDNKIPLCVMTDGVRIRQVISNLLSNAIKFTTQQGRVDLNIILIEEKDQKVKVRFEVKDTGIGIPEDKLKTIFNPFIQVDHKSNREFEGTGLGLSICTHIVESLNSKIEIESIIGTGTKFWFDLELDVCEDDVLVKKDYYNSLNFKIIDMDSDIYHYAKRYLNIFGSIDDETRDINVVICTCTNKTKDRLEEVRQEYKDVPMLILYEYEDDLNMFELKNNEEALALPFYPSKLNDSLQELLRKTNSIDLNQKEASSSDAYKGTVLIAEDNLANQELISYILESMGLEFTIKDDGLKTLNEYTENPDKYDVIFMDINMPVMDGIESFSQIRKYESSNNLNQTPIIALTANAIKGDREKFLKLGMDDYLSKPINTKELKSIFDKFIRPDSLIAHKTDIQTDNIVNNEVVIDLEKITKKLGVGENIAQLIVKKFKKDIVKDIDELESYIQENKEEEISQKAHYVKNSCLNVALDEVCDLLQELENKNLSFDKKKEIFSDIKKIIKSI